MAFEFTTNHSELLIDAPIIAVRRDSVTMPSGNEANREVVEHFGAIAVVAFDGERIALVTQYRHSVGRRLVELPAGLLDVAGEDELECAKRELVEEAGLEAQQWSVLADLVTSPGFADEAVRVFLAQDLSETVRPEAEDEEADMTMQWVALNDAVAMVLRGEIVNSIAISGIMAANQVINHGGVARDVKSKFEMRPTALAKRRMAEGFTGDMKKIPANMPQQNPDQGTEGRG